MRLGLGHAVSVRLLASTTRESDAGGRKFDLVIASYSLGELEAPLEQKRALRALWRATADTLVIIEPGTPLSSSLVRAARQQVSRLGFRVYLPFESLEV